MQIAETLKRDRDVKELEAKIQAQEKEVKDLEDKIKIQKKSS